MRYLKVIWHHDFPDQPVIWYAEIGDDGYETRAIEVYRDGRYDYADEQRSTGETILAEAPIPSAEDIAKNAELSPTVIAVEEFENVWRRALAGAD
jgi:uncharacterized protein DUF6881